MTPTAIRTMASDLPEIHWLQGDDACDCAIQRVGEWTNPYIARTFRVRLCCLYQELAKQYPQFFQEVPAFYDANRHSWRKEPAEWDSDEMDMPVYLWYRQLAALSGKPLADVRRKHEMQKHLRPKKISTAEREARAIAARPTDAEVKAARAARLKATGWVTE